MCLCSLCLFRGECTDTLRRRITELETECKKLTMDIKLKEDQIRELELKVQVKMKACSTVKRPSGDISASKSSTFSFSVSARSFINIRKMKKTQRC